MRDVGSSLLRRWYLTLAGVLATAGLAVLALQVVHPTWESKASLVLLPPKSTVLPGGNPYLQLGGLEPTLDLLIVSLGDQQTATAIKQIAPTADYTVVADTTSSGPVMIVTAHDRTAVGALAARDQVARTAPDVLVTLQDNLAIPVRSRITSMVLTADAKPLLVSKNQIRAVVVAVGAGLVGTSFTVAMVDGYILRRRSSVGRGRKRALSPLVDPSRWVDAAGVAPVDAVVASTVPAAVPAPAVKAPARVMPVAVPAPVAVTPAAVPAPAPALDPVRPSALPPSEQPEFDPWDWGGDQAWGSARTNGASAESLRS